MKYKKYDEYIKSDLENISKQGLISMLLEAEIEFENMEEEIKDLNEWKGVWQGSFLFCILLLIIAILA